MSTGIPAAARPLQGQRAGIVTRLLANAVDAAVVSGATVSVYLSWAALVFMVNPTTFRAPSAPFLFWVLLAGGISWTYWTVGWATTGRSIGKQVLGLRVVNARGERLHWAGAAVRAAFCLVFMVGLLWVAPSGKNRSLQDSVLRTSVIYDWTRHGPAGNAARRSRSRAESV
jgi:uncharacterized RDD family membrane protein YckC